jgi:hypothetical protein
LGTTQRQRSIVRASGVTRGERYLGDLCRRSFLSLWSYPAPYRDQGDGRGHGKEICDLLVVFGNDVIVFSDKEVAFQADLDLHLAWKR